MGKPAIGTARALRQHRHDMYALRFEKVPGADADVLGALVSANSG